MLVIYLALEYLRLGIDKHVNSNESLRFGSYKITTSPNSASAFLNYFFLVLLSVLLWPTLSCPVCQIDVAISSNHQPPSFLQVTSSKLLKQPWRLCRRTILSAPSSISTIAPMSPVRRLCSTKILVLLPFPPKLQRRRNPPTNSTTSPGAAATMVPKYPRPLQGPKLPSPRAASRTPSLRTSSR